MKNRDYYIRRAEVGFKTLVIYYCVTRPQYEKAYHKGGKFDKDVLMRQMDFLSTWKNSRGRREKQLLARKYSEYARTFNFTFDIPVELVQKIIGKYRGSRISIEEITTKLVKEGWLRVLKSGNRTKKGVDGKAHVVYWWHNKYLLANKKYWLQLLLDKKYSDYQKYPRDEEGFIQRAVSIIAKFRKQTINTEEKDMTVDELKEEFAKEASMNTTMLPDVPMKANAEYDIYADIPPEEPKQEVVSAKSEAKKIETPVAETPVEKVEVKEPPKAKEQLKPVHIRRLDSYIERFKDGVLTKETFVKYLKEDFGNARDAAIEYVKNKMVNGR